MHLQNTCCAGLCRRRRWESSKKFPFLYVTISLYSRRLLFGKRHPPLMPRPNWIFSFPTDNILLSNSVRTPRKAALQTFYPAFDVHRICFTNFGNRTETVKSNIYSETIQITFRFAYFRESKLFGTKCTIHPTDIMYRNQRQITKLHTFAGIKISIPLNCITYRHNNRPRTWQIENGLSFTRHCWQCNSERTKGVRRRFHGIYDDDLIRPCRGIKCNGGGAMSKVTRRNRGDKEGR